MNSLNNFVLNYKPLGSYALLIEWPNKIDPSILEEIISLQQVIESELSEKIFETINAYCSLTILYKEQHISLSDLIEKVKFLYHSGQGKEERISKTWKIPVCYDEAYGIDLQDIAKAKKCTVTDIIELHTSPRYLVYFTGFLPGFLYLGGLPATLVIPRKASPRLQIIKGAVAIGGQQTGIYPNDSPGGWNIIGNCPLEFFDPAQHPPCFSRPGDYLKFYAIDKADHQKIKQKVETKSYTIDCE